MSYNDRLAECARWVSAQPSGLVTLPAKDVAQALWEAADDCRWPWPLTAWVRDTARHASPSTWSQTCWDAAAPTDEWVEHIRYDDDPLRIQPPHEDCDQTDCACPCHPWSRPARSIDHRIGAMEAIAAIRAERPNHEDGCRRTRPLGLGCTCLIGILDAVAADYQEA